jgi:hypothetical protein
MRNSVPLLSLVNVSDPAVRFDHGAGDGQAETGAAVCPRT